MALIYFWTLMLNPILNLVQIPRMSLTAQIIFWRLYGFAFIEWNSIVQGPDKQELKKKKKEITVCCSQIIWCKIK